MSLRTNALGAAALSVALALALLPAPAGAGGEGDRKVQIGELIQDVELPTLDGRKDRLLARGMKANVFVFFRPGQDHSLETLKELAGCEADFRSKPVRFVGIVSDAWPAEEVRATVAESGVRMPVLVDRGDALYAALGVRLHPLIGIVDASRKLVAWEPFRRINYCERARVRVRHLLGEVSEAEIAKVDQPEQTGDDHAEEGVAKRRLNYARTLMKMGEHADALAQVQEALLIFPSAAAYALQGEVLAALGKCPDAAKAFEAALRIDPRNVVAQTKRSSCGG